jgi:site-specific recombinase XerD
VPRRSSSFVIASSVGRPLDHRNVLRHACATLLLEDGEELANVSKLLGHSSLATTADFYGHLNPGISKRAAERMGAILAG